MDISRLQVFLAVLDIRNFAKAADKLGMSQPGVSKNIKALEEHLNVPLFERGRYGAIPTQYAEAVEHRAKLILAESRLIEAEIDAMRGSRKGKLTIGADPSFLPKILPEALGLFRKRWPDIYVDVKVGVAPELFSQLRRGEIEFVVSIPPVSLLTEEFARQELAYQRAPKLVMNAKHPLTRIGTLSLRDISRFPWVAIRGLGDWEKVADVYLQAGLHPPKIALETNSTVAAKAAAQLSELLCVLDSPVFELEEKGNVLASRSYDALFEQRSAYVSYRRRSPLPPPARNMLGVISSVCESSDQQELASCATS